MLLSDQNPLDQSVNHHQQQHQPHQQQQQQQQQQQHQQQEYNDSDKRLSLASTSSKRTKTHVGPWRLGRTLGRGSSGRVRLAKHNVTGQLAAVKIVPKELVNNNGNNFGIEREVIIMKLIEHPNVMALYDVWENKGELYLVLEYIEGGELFDYLLRKGRLDEKEAIHYFRQIINGVDYCHQFNICHRDLKPENLLLDKNRNIKIADFGMAALEVSDKMLQTSCGSPHYASPEIVSGKNYHGGPSDIWSCGIILFALLTGHLPFDDQDIRTLLLKVQAGVFQMPKYISIEAQDLISRMLCVDPEKRISMADIIQHPLIRKYQTKKRHIINNQVNLPFNVYKPISSVEEIDPEILKNLQILWHGAKRQDVIAQLISEEHTSEKTFYCLLMKYRFDNQEQNTNTLANIPSHESQNYRQMKKSSSITSRGSRQFHHGHGHPRPHGRNRSQSSRRHSRATSRSSIVTASSSHKRGVSFPSVKSIRSLKQRARSNTSIKSYYDNHRESPPPPMPMDVLNNLQQQQQRETEAYEKQPTPIEHYQSSAEKYQALLCDTAPEHYEQYDHYSSNAHSQVKDAEHTKPDYDQTSIYSENYDYHQNPGYGNKVAYDNGPNYNGNGNYNQTTHYESQYTGQNQYELENENVKQNSHEFASMLEEAFDYPDQSGNNTLSASNSRRPRIVSDPFPTYNSAVTIPSQPQLKERRVVSDYMQHVDYQNSMYSSHSPKKTNHINPAKNSVSAANRSYEQRFHSDSANSDFLLPLIFEEDDRFADAIEEEIGARMANDPNDMDDPNKTPEFTQNGFQFQDSQGPIIIQPEPILYSDIKLELPPSNELQLPEIPDTPTYEDNHLRNVHTAARAASIAATATSHDSGNMNHHDLSTIDDNTINNFSFISSANNNDSMYDQDDDSDTNSILMNDNLRIPSKEEIFKQRPQSMFANYPGTSPTKTDQAYGQLNQRRNSHHMLMSQNFKIEEEQQQPLQPPPHLVKPNFMESPKLNTHAISLKPISVKTSSSSNSNITNTNSNNTRSASTPVTINQAVESPVRAASHSNSDDLSVTSPFTSDNSDRPKSVPTNNVIINTDNGKSTLFRKLSLNPKRPAPPPPSGYNNAANNKMNSIASSTVSVNNKMITPPPSQPNSRATSGSSEMSYMSHASHHTTVSSVNSHSQNHISASNIQTQRSNLRTVSQDSKSSTSTTVVYKSGARRLPSYNAPTNDSASTITPSSVPAKAQARTSKSTINTQSRLNTSPSANADSVKQNWFMKMLNLSSSAPKPAAPNSLATKPQPAANTQPLVKSSASRLNRFSTLSSTNLLSNYNTHTPYTSYTSTTPSPLVRTMILDTLRDWKQYGISDIKVEELGQSPIKIKSAHVPLKIKISAKVSSRNVLSLRSTTFLIELEMQKVRESVPILPPNPVVVTANGNNSSNSNGISQSNGRTLFKRLLSGGRKHLSNTLNNGVNSGSNRTASNGSAKSNGSSSNANNNVQITTKYLTNLSLYQMKGSNSTFLRFSKELEDVLVSKGVVTSNSLNGGYVDVDDE